MTEARPCRCRSCIPNSAPEVCSRCGEEIRFGTREGGLGYWHRESVDHAPIHGHMAYPDISNTLEVEEEIDPLQQAVVEVWATPVDRTEFAGTSGLRQIANLASGETRVMPNGKTSKSKKHPAAAPGWELVNITHSRGPYRGSKGEVLSVSDTHVLRARGPVGVDGSRRVAVGSWRDLAFDFAFIGTIRGGRLTDTRRVGSDEMKDWIKGHDLPDPVQEQR